jgi:hypothetical protein
MDKAAPNATLTIFISVPVTWEAVGSVPASARVTIKPAPGNAWAAIGGDKTQNLALSSGALEIQSAHITGTHTYTVASNDAAASLAFTGSRFEPSGSLLATSLLKATGNAAALVVTNTDFIRVVVTGKAGFGGA